MDEWNCGKGSTDAMRWRSSFGVGERGVEGRRGSRTEEGKGVSLVHGGEDAFVQFREGSEFLLVD